MNHLTEFRQNTARFIRLHWIGTLLIFAVTLIFFWPIVTHISSYSEGGDAMFNAWTLARDQNCILRNDCPSYVDGNIFFPHKDTMLYSETQLSAGLLTMPLRWINSNPIFSYNIWTIISFFLMGWFMYLLAKYLSKNNEIVAILAGLIFELAPFRMSAIAHLQNISIFYLPLAFLLIFKFLETKKKAYLFALFTTLSLQFYASWYQMVFVLIALGILLAGMAVLKLIKIKPLATLALVIILAVASTYPLAKEYMRFSKTNSASFSIQDQAKYSSSLIDYITPEQGTALGKIFYNTTNFSHKNSYNPDSISYHGLLLSVVGICVLIIAYMKRRKGLEAMRRYKMALVFASIGLVGFIISLGPLLKVKGEFYYHDAATNLLYTIPLPYIIVDKILPQLSFIRALGRASVLLLFALCCLLAFAPLYANKYKFSLSKKRLIGGFAIAIIALELMPLHQVPMRSTAYSYNLSVPKVYEYIKSHEEINNLIILSSDWDYPDAGIPIKLPEQVMWAGYHNKNIFNGYSGYLPPEYYAQFYDYVDFDAKDISKLKKMDLRYVMVDKLLSKSNPRLPSTVSDVLGSKHKIYEDMRFVLFKVAS